MGQSGLVDGRHYTTYVEDVRRLKRIGNQEAAERLLLRLVDATEAEARAERWGVAPWYYEQLAILYARRGGRRPRSEHPPGGGGWVDA